MERTSERAMNLSGCGLDRRPGFVGRMRFAPGILAFAEAQGPRLLRIVGDSMAVPYRAS